MVSIGIFDLQKVGQGRELQHRRIHADEPTIGQGKNATRCSSTNAFKNAIVYISGVAGEPGYRGLPDRRPAFIFQEWLESQGIEVSQPDDPPVDPYIENRRERETLQMVTTPSDFDKLRQFLEMDRKVLRFYAVWDDRDRMFGQMRKFIINVRYFLFSACLEMQSINVDS